ncbi:MAG: adenine phosphoribosyltransferase [Candidatus Omnitrophica bacterium]|nr:adenine phosphoribosyltransferase [Candidatus Omnitrophota bacterium]
MTSPVFADASKLKAAIRTVPDFPKPGILYRDITPVLSDPALFSSAIDGLCSGLEHPCPDMIVGIESRGFLFAAAMAYKLKTGFAPVRKNGKLPFDKLQVRCELEYGEAVLEIHRDALSRGAAVVIVDDCLATGGTAEAAASLVEDLGGRVEKMIFLMELEALKGRQRLQRYEVASLIRYGV